MPVVPHDLEDLRLAPVVLALDGQIESMAQLGPGELAGRVALEGGMPVRTPVQREQALLESVRHRLDLHGWLLALDRRGVRVTHGTHSLVLGAPPSFEDYVHGGHRRPEQRA